MACLNDFRGIMFTDAPLSRMVLGNSVPLMITVTYRGRLWKWETALSSFENVIDDIILLASLPIGPSHSTDDSKCLLAISSMALVASILESGERLIRSKNYLNLTHYDIFAKCFLHFILIGAGIQKCDHIDHF